MSPRFASPADAVNTFGRTLSEHLTGFAWVKSGRKLLRRKVQRTELVTVQASRFNRTGVSVAASLYFRLEDAGLQAWRQSIPLAVSTDSAWVIGHPVGYLIGSSIRDGEFQLVTESDLQAAIDAVVPALQQHVLSLFDLAEDIDAFVANGTGPSPSLLARGADRLADLPRSRRPLTSAG